MEQEDLILSVERFKFIVGITKGTDDGWMVPSIIQATDMLTAQIIGTDLTDKLITDYNAGTLAGLYLEVYPMIEKMVSWQAYVLGLPRMAYRISNNGIVRNTSAQTENAAFNEIAFLQRGAAATVAMWENRVKNFLGDNRNDIPELSTNTCDWYLPNLRSDTSQGTTYSQNNTYSDF